jgi:hypothetical protein
MTSQPDKSKSFWKFTFTNDDKKYLKRALLIVPLLIAFRLIMYYYVDEPARQKDLARKKLIASPSGRSSDPNGWMPRAFRNETSKKDVSNPELEQNGENKDQTPAGSERPKHE